SIRDGLVTRVHTCALPICSRASSAGPAPVARVASWTGEGPADEAPERLHARTRELLVAYAKLRSSDPARVERVAEQARAYARIQTGIAARRDRYVRCVEVV